MHGLHAPLGLGHFLWEYLSSANADAIDINDTSVRIISTTNSHTLMMTVVSWSAAKPYCDDELNCCVVSVQIGGCANFMGFTSATHMDPSTVGALLLSNDVLLLLSLAALKLTREVVVGRPVSTPPGSSLAAKEGEANSASFGGVQVRAVSGCRV